MPNLLYSCKAGRRRCSNPLQPNYVHYVKWRDRMCRKLCIYKLLCKPLPRAKLRQETSLLAGRSKAKCSLVTAGSDTASISLSSIFFYLTGDPRHLRKLEDELLSTFTSIDKIYHGPILKGCTYLRACVNEAIRIAIVDLSEIQREVLPGGINIKGKHYPARTIVGYSPWLDCRNQQVYGDTQVYRTERWIVDEENGMTQQDVARANMRCVGVRHQKRCP